MKKKNCVRANMIQYLYNKNEFVLKERSYFSPVLLNKSISSIVMQNGESQKRRLEETRHAKFSVLVNIRG